MSVESLAEQRHSAESQHSKQQQLQAVPPGQLVQLSISISGGWRQREAGSISQRSVLQQHSQQGSEQQQGDEHDWAVSAQTLARDIKIRH